MTREMKKSPEFCWGVDKYSYVFDNEGYITSLLVLGVNCSNTQLDGIVADLNFLVGDGKNPMIRFGQFTDERASDYKNGVFIGVRSNTKGVDVLRVLREAIEDYNLAKSESEEEIPDIDFIRITSAA